MIILLFNRLLIGCVFARAHTHTQFSYILYLHTVNVLYMYRTYYIYIYKTCIIVIVPHDCRQTGGSFFRYELQCKYVK